jgi:hypothetical protein
LEQIMSEVKASPIQPVFLPGKQSGLGNQQGA